MMNGGDPLFGETPLNRQFILLKWERAEAWLVAKVQLSLALILLRGVRLLRRVGLAPESSVNGAITVATELARRANAAWDAFLLKRDLVKARAQRHLSQADQRTGRQYSTPANLLRVGALRVRPTGYV